MALKPAYTKRGDTEMVWAVNMNLAGANVKAFAKAANGAITELPAVVNIDGNVVITTSSLVVGSYNLEVQVTVGGKIATFPDSGYVKLVVVQDLGD